MLLCNALLLLSLQGKLNLRIFVLQYLFFSIYFFHLFFISWGQMEIDKNSSAVKEKKKLWGKRLNKVGNFLSTLFSKELINYLFLFLRLSWEELKWEYNGDNFASLFYFLSKCIFISADTFSVSPTFCHLRKFFSFKADKKFWFLWIFIKVEICF